MKKICFILAIISIFTGSAYGAFQTDELRIKDSGGEYAKFTGSFASNKTITVPDETGTMVTTESINTSSELASIVGDETGTGALVFADSPTLGAVTATTLNTGQGAYELYGMDQNVLTSSTPSFAGVTLTDRLSHSQTVNTNSIPGASFTVTPSTLLDGSSYTGTDTTMSTTYIAVKFTASSSDTMGDFQVRLKESGTFSNPYDSLSGYIYSDDGGSPSKPSTLLTSANGRMDYHALTTSYALYSFWASRALVSGTTYWLVLKQSVAPSGASIVFDSTAGTDYGATSSDGSTWTNTNNRLYHVIRARNYYGIYSSSQNNVAGYFAAENNYGIYASSDSFYGAYIESISNDGMQVHSYSGHGVKSTSENSNGLYGLSNGSTGVRGESTASYGVSAISNLSTTNQPISPMANLAQSTGTVANGFGGGIEYRTENASGSVKTTMFTGGVYSDATNGSEDYDFIIQLMAGGSAKAEKMRMASDGLLTVGAAGTDGSLKLYSEQGATDYFTLFQPGTQTQDVTYTLPVDDGTAGQVLHTDGSGVLTWDSDDGAGGGAPTDADYLVGTANGSLSAEIVVGTSPGGELGGTWASPTLDDSVAVTSWNLTTPTITTSVDLGATGVRVSDDADGAVTLLGLGDGNDEDLNINLDDTANTITLSSTTGVNTIAVGSDASPIGITFGNDGTLRFGNSGANADIAWETGQTVDDLQIGVRVGANSVSGHVSIMERADMGNANRQPPNFSNDPALLLWSADATSTTDYIRVRHDQTNGEIDLGSGDLNILDAVNVSGKVTANASLDVKNGATSSGVLAIFEDSDNGTNKATFQVPALAADTVYTLPSDDGTSGQYLKTDGSGTLSWDTPAGGSGGAKIIPLPIQSAKITGAYVTATITGVDVATQGAQIDGGDGNWRLLFDATTDEAAVWQVIVPDNYTSTPVIKIQYSMTSGNTNEVEWEGAVMCVTPGDSADVGTASFATASTAVETVPGTAGHTDSLVSITPTDDSCATGDLMYVYISTDADDATNDDATGDRELVGAYVSYT